MNERLDEADEDETKSMTDPNGGNNGNLIRIAQHAAAAAAFFFILQRFALKESVEVSLLWAAFFAIAAGLLAWQQARR